MPPTKHAILGASSAHRWIACPPSARLNERLNERFGAKTSVYAEEGTRAHALGEAKIRYALWRADHMTAAKHGALSPEEREAYSGININRYKAMRKDVGEITDEMEKATDTYCDVVMERFLRAREEDSTAQLFLEQRLDYSQWAPSGFGTGDAVIVSDTLLDVLDFKFGKGVEVSAEGNPQMRLYALGALARFGVLYDFQDVRCTIIQPRVNAERLSSEYTTREELLTWAEEIVAPAARLAWEGKGDFSPGEHCRWCAAKAVCAARAAEALKIYDYGLAGSGELTTEQIAAILPMLDGAEAWIKDLRAYTEESALHGERYRGYKLVRGKKPNRAWTDEDEVKAALLRSGYGPETYERTVLRSPSDVAKTLGAKAFRAIIEEQGLIKQGEGRLVLVPESDSRPEFNSAEAAFEDMASPNENHENHETTET